MNELFEIRQTKQMGKGVFALIDIPIGTQLIKLDKKTFITYSMISCHPFLWRLQRTSQQNIDRKVSFAFYMSFIDKFRQYQHQPKRINQLIKYINNLPLKYNNLICYNDDELQRIQNMELINKVKQKREKLRKEVLVLKKFLIEKTSDLDPCYYSAVCFQNDEEENQQIDMIQDYQNLGQCELQNEMITNTFNNQQQLHKKYQTDFSQYKQMCNLIDFNDVLRFYAAIQSRHVYYETQLDKKSELGALIPTLELFNHSPDGQALKNTKRLQSIRQIKKNQQIFVNYAEFSDEDLLQKYGIVIDERFYQIRNQYINKNVNNIKSEQKYEGMKNEFGFQSETSESSDKSVEREKEKFKEYKQEGLIKQEIKNQRVRLIQRYNKLKKLQRIKKQKQQNE